MAVTLVVACVDCMLAVEIIFTLHSRLQRPCPRDSGPQKKSQRVLAASSFQPRAASLHRHSLSAFSFANCCLDIASLCDIHPPISPPQSNRTCYACCCPQPRTASKHRRKQSSVEAEAWKQTSGHACRALNMQRAIVQARK